MERSSLDSSSGSWVAMPMGQRPEPQALYLWHPRAMSGPDASATASAPMAMALAQSPPVLRPPVMTSSWVIPWAYMYLLARARA